MQHKAKPTAFESGMPGYKDFSFFPKGGFDHPLPDLPWSVSALPEIIEIHLVSKRIHGVPELCVPEGNELFFLGESLHGHAFKRHMISFDILKDFWLHYEEAGVDPGTILFRLLPKSGDNAIFIQIKYAPSSQRKNRRDGCNLALRVMKFNQITNVNIRNPISIGEQEWLIVNIGLYPFHPAPGLGLRAGIHKGNGPWLCLVIMDDLLVLVFEIVSNVRLMQEVITEIFFDVISPVSKTEHKIVETEMGVDLHDMPNNGVFSYFDHGLWFQMGFFTYSGSKSATKDYYFHGPSLKNTETMTNQKNLALIRPNLFRISGIQREPTKIERRDPAMPAVKTEVFIRYPFPS